MEPSLKSIGTSQIRKEGRDKVTGQSRYVDDLFFPGQIFGATVRSPVAAGTISKINFGPGIPWDEFVIVTAEDIPGQNHVFLYTEDQPLLVESRFRHAEEAVVLLAHPDIHMLTRAKHAISFDITEEPSIHTIEESLDQSVIVWGKDNIFEEINIEKGHVQSAWESADYIVEGEYETGAQEHMYIEPNGMIARFNDNEGLVIWGSMQCPFYVQTALSNILDLPADRIRVIQTETGGGFGGKEDYPSMIAGHAALLAYKSGKTVRLIYDRSEDMAATTKRHPSRTKHKTAVSKKGEILAMEIDFYIDGGAYSTVSPAVLSRGALHAAGPYNCKNVKIHAKALATNTTPYGAFRGFGAPQSTFAMERHINKIARTIGMDAQELRFRNLLKSGDATSSGQVIEDDIDMKQMMQEVLRRTNFREKQARFRNENQASKIKKGIGLASFYHGTGFTGDGEKHLASTVGIEAGADGLVRLLVSSTEMGQGANTVLSQIAAEALSVDYDTIRISRRDTHAVPNSGPTVASRTTMVVGRIIETACAALLEKLEESGFLKVPYTTVAFGLACGHYVDKNGPLKVFGHYLHPEGGRWDEKGYRGDAYATFTWAVYVCEVSVDTVTYHTTVDRVSAFQEVGRVINPLLAAGQIEGGVAQGAGLALYEKVIWNKGIVENRQMTNYIIPTSKDVGEIDVVFFENPSGFGPAGAKGIGELPVDGTPPAIINAVEDALGVGVTKVPMLPEDLFQALTQNSREQGNA